MARDREKTQLIEHLRGLLGNDVEGRLADVGAVSDEVICDNDARDYIDLR